jgi:hypothetical protein
MQERTVEIGFEARLAREAKASATTLMRNRIRAALALTLAAASVFLAVSYVDREFSANPLAALGRTANQVGAVQRAVAVSYSGQADFAGLDDDVVASGGGLPPGMVRRGRLLNAFGGAIHVGPAADGGFLVTFAGIPGWACPRLATMDAGDSMARVAVTSEAQAASSESGPLALRPAARACGRAGGGADITWIFR